MIVIDAMPDAMPDELIDSMAAISLDQIQADADLQTRVDRKYIVTVGDLGRAIDALGDDLRALEIGGRRSFGYESVYFDTPDLRCYLAAARDRDQRFKVRTRVYSDSGWCVLEVKVRSRRGETVKHQMDYERNDQHRLTDNARRFVTSLVDLPDGGHELEPVLTTRYRRSTLTDGRSRLTVDADLRCTRGDGATLALDDRVIVETKSTGVVTPADRYLWSRGLRPMTISKFAVGIAGLDPTLPANKWNQTLRRYFGWMPERSHASRANHSAANSERPLP